MLQVPSTVKADKRQLEVLLDESKDIARSIDGKLHGLVAGNVVFRLS